MKQERIHRILDAKMMELVQKQRKEQQAFEYSALINGDVSNSSSYYDTQQECLYKKHTNEREDFLEMRNRINQRLNSDEQRQQKKQPFGLQCSTLETKLNKQMGDLLTRHVQEKEAIKRILAGKAISEHDYKEFGICYQGKNLMIGNYYFSNIDYKHVHEVNQLLRKQERLREKFHELNNQRKEREQGQGR